MKSRIQPFVVVVTAGLLAVSPAFLSAAKTTHSHKPSKPASSLSPELAEKLKNLPYGLSKQQSLFIRFKHVESVQYFGAGQKSRFGFIRGQSLMPEGLSLLLKTDGKENWANGAVQFKKPLDVSKYNSLVMWARASKPEMRIWMGLRSEKSDGKKTSPIPARTDVLPLQGFPVGEPVQLVIPLSRFFSKPALDLAAINQMTFEFGQETVGNPHQGTIEILGFAFIEQSENLKRAQVVMNRAKPKIVLGESAKSIAPDDPSIPVSAALASQAEPLAPPPPPPLSRLGRSVKDFLKMSDFEARNFFKQMGLDFFPRKDIEKDAEARPIKSPKSFAREWIQPYARRWPALPAPVTDKHTAVIPSSNEGGSNMWYFLTVCALLVAWIVVRRRSAWPLVAPRLGKVMHEIHWPFLVTDSDNRRLERDFWKGVAGQQVRFGWLSTADLMMEKNSAAEFFGESFLLRQIKAAARANVRMFPSISFTDTVFRKGALLSNPQRSASALRTLATETLMRFAEVASGARIEDAAQLLNAKLRRRASRLQSKNGERGFQEREFWTDVISAVKEKHPDFLFIADGVGHQTKLAREVGFDYFENDELLHVLNSQIRSGEVGELGKLLAATPEDLLKHSIFNITSLVKPLPKKQSEQHQSFLAAVLLALLPGILQHDDSLPEDLNGFIARIARSSVLRKGNFVLLEASSPRVFAFARWQKKSLFIAVANFSTLLTEVVVRLNPIQEGLEKNKLYLFNNALHGASALKSWLNQSDSGGPAMALWGQNLRDIGLPLALPELSLSLFSVSLSYPITSKPTIIPPAQGAIEHAQQVQ